MMTHRRLSCLFSLVIFATCISRNSAASETDFVSEASDIQPWLVKTRRALHQVPELIYEEYKTSEYIRKSLDELGVSYR